MNKMNMLSMVIEGLLDEVQNMVGGSPLTVDDSTPSNLKNDPAYQDFLKNMTGDSAVNPCTTPSVNSPAIDSLTTLMESLNPSIEDTSLNMKKTMESMKETPVGIVNLDTAPIVDKSTTRKLEIAELAKQIFANQTHTGTELTETKNAKKAFDVATIFYNVADTIDVVPNVVPDPVKNTPAPKKVVAKAPVAKKQTAPKKVVAKAPVAKKQTAPNTTKPRKRT